VSVGERRPAVFFDRDGTLIEDIGYIRRPDDVRLTHDAARALRLVNGAGWLAIVVTNQSGIARGLLTEADYARVRDQMDALVAAQGARVDAHYHCPHHPEFGGPCECRKPGTALFARAIGEHAIDVARSAFIGDRWRDIAPAAALGGRAMLVPGGRTPVEEIERARIDAEIADTLLDAVTRALSLPPDPRG
jgi:D-glycero-D-manno-heptose 1,7-bisphosphate phosphatase